MEALWQDFRYASRMLFKKPAFTLVAVMTLGLGIGANTAIFSVVNAVLLRPLPYKDSDRLIRIIQNRSQAPQGMPRRIAAMATDDLQEWRKRTQTLSHLAAYQRSSLTLTGREEPVRLVGAAVSPELFPMLGAQPMMGRGFEDAEEKPGANNVVILSYAAWQRFFGGDQKIIGAGIMLEGRGYSVIGVMPDSFEFPDRDTLFWTPFVMTPIVRVPGERMIQLVQTLARIKDGVSLEQATAEANTIFRQLRDEEDAFDARSDGPPNDSDRGGEGRGRGRGDGGVMIARGGPDGSGRGPDGPGRGPRGERGGPPVGVFGMPSATIELVSWRDELVAPVRPALMVLLASVGFVLLIACANVANLLLARAASRQQEIAIRGALGAGRGRLIRQALTESVLLAALGGTIGIILSFWGVRLLTALGTGSIPRLNEISTDAPVFVFTVAISLLTGILFGLAPALRLSRTDRMQALKEGATCGASGLDLFRRNRTRSSLAVAEIAMAMVLLVGAGLLINSFLKLSNVDPGYDPENVLTFQVALPQARYPIAQRNQFYEQLLGQLQAQPGVEAAAMANTLPLQQGGIRISVNVQGRPHATRPEEIVLGDVRIVSSGYVKAMGLDLLDGRTLNESDREGQPPVLLINKTMARRHFANENPIGERMQLGGPDPWQIVGVVDDVKHAGLDAESQPEIYMDFRQARSEMTRGGPGGMFFAIRTSGVPSAIVSSVRALVIRLDPQLTVDNVASMEQRLSDSVSRPRFYAVLLGIFAAVAVTLAAVGIYGVMAYSVSLRTREIGIRIALGARRGEVLALVLRQGIVLTAIGITAGLAGAFAVTRYLDSMLFGVTPFDPLTFAGVAGLLAGISAIACWVPARRATRVDPIIALRWE